ncbi:MAG: RimK family alpha-L-glutamate ligase [Candidatus Brockarchaeota archaeon]|nr:RimK family alpha-L-glutamate ligase [Candidatus Brockarchaeota archaeon]
MKFALLSRNPLGWVTRSLGKEFADLGHTATIVSSRALVASLGQVPKILASGFDLSSDFNAVLLRVLGFNSLDETLHVIETCRSLERLGQVLVNSEKATSNCLNKFGMLDKLSASGVKVPATRVVRRVEDGIKAFEEMGDVVLKPIFGSRGMGVVRAADAETAKFALEEMVFRGQVPLVQEFVAHEGFDVRALVVGGRVAAAMKRESPGLRTNISRGGKPIPMKVDAELEEIALKASGALSCDYSGVDLLPSSRGTYVLEVNSQPDYRALQSVTGRNISSEIAGLVIQKARR